VTEMLEAIEAAGSRHGVTIANIAHAGDGKPPPALRRSAGDDDARLRAQAAFDDIIGCRHRPRWDGERRTRHRPPQASRPRRPGRPDVMALYTAVKQALDPAGILNPGQDRLSPSRAKREPTGPCGRARRAGPSALYESSSFSTSPMILVAL